MLRLTDASQAPLDVSRRTDEAEWLDDANLHPTELKRVLHDLARFNGTMFGRRIMVSWLARAINDAPTATPLTVLDVGCGYGDLLREIRSRAKRRSRALILIGLDISHETIRIARSATDPADEIDYQVSSVFDFEPTAPVDLVVSSIVMNHLSDELIIRFLVWMERTARRGWLICDLQRHIVPYYFMTIATYPSRVISITSWSFFARVPNC